MVTRTYETHSLQWMLNSSYKLPLHDLHWFMLFSCLFSEPKRNGISLKLVIGIVVMPNFCKDAPAAVVQHRLEWHYHMKDKNDTKLSGYAIGCARTPWDFGSHRTWLTFHYILEPKSWPQPATPSSRCWNKISRCNQSSVDAECGKDEV